MPIYEYQCEDCKEPFEVFVRSMRAQADPICPHCGSAHVEKEVSAAAALGLGDGASLNASALSCAPSG